MSVLSTPLDHVYYLYSRSDYYPRGELLESDELRASGQDLIFEQFRAPLHSKPLAWAELVMARVSEAATKSGAYHPLLLGLLLALVTLTTIAITATASIAVARLLVVEATPITHGAFFLVLLAAVLGVLAGGGVAVRQGRSRAQVKSHGKSQAETILESSHRSRHSGRERPPTPPPPRCEIPGRPQQTR